ncbi:unnamed protein product [Paramecium octaurelia]|uniref:Uncharacterized protein n=1 Tax=Paramecium octaurelia TaxID=43137 RepID=A0A8S1V893_PAROT|nr:unnamed protein product [Paramecium octaurelia]
MLTLQSTFHYCIISFRIYIDKTDGRKEGINILFKLNYIKILFDGWEIHFIIMINFSFSVWNMNRSMRFQKTLNQLKSQSYFINIDWRMRHLGNKLTIQLIE